MHKDKLALLLLLTVFALLGADCRAPWEDDDVKERPLPQRAFASSPLLRAYYDMRTFPEEMRELKIPEGDDFDDEHLTVQFDMGGSVSVTEVRTHLYLMPPKSADFNDCELVVRCVAPDGTASAWKPLDVQQAATWQPQVEVSFLYEFDGINSDGTWRVQIKDYLGDGDGRCLFRNGSLHINRGESAALAAHPTRRSRWTRQRVATAPSRRPRACASRWTSVGSEPAGCWRMSSRSRRRSSCRRL